MLWNLFLVAQNEKDMRQFMYTWPLCQLFYYVIIQHCVRAMSVDCKSFFFKHCELFLIICYWRTFDAFSPIPCDYMLKTTDMLVIELHWNRINLQYK